MHLDPSTAFDELAVTSGKVYSMFPTWQEADLPLPIFEAAMSMCDALGRDVFRRHWGGTFTRADGQHVYHGNRGPYEARPLIAAAYSLRYPQATPLQPQNFTGTDAHQYLSNKGFDLRSIG